MSLQLAGVIPAYNAAGTLGELLQRLRHQGLGRIVVVDDGSSDGTGTIADDAGVIFVRHEVNRGKGAALRTGFERLMNEADWQAVITLDADLQHRPEDIPAFVEKQAETGADIIIGLRKRWRTGMPWARRLSNTITSFLVSVRTGQQMKDSQCGFRLIRREVIENIRFESDGYEAETEFLIRAAKAGYRVAFTPIQTIYNSQRSYMTHGKTTKRFLQVLMKEYP